MPDFTKLTLEEIADILGRHVGAKAELSRRANVDPTLISKVLSGRSVSARLVSLAQALCAELLKKEEVDRLAHGEANGPSVRKVIDEIRKAPKREE
jgi:transcriptional regulator with XRE-family HTH domain